MPSSRGPLLTLPVHTALIEARDARVADVGASLDLGRSTSTVGITSTHWTFDGKDYPYAANCKDRTIYHWTGEAWDAVSRYADSLIKLVPTEWGAPTFEIDGIKMLPTAQVSPYADAQSKVGLIQPRGKRILDSCGGLGYFAACCIENGAQRIESWEKNADVIWLRTLNPWSPLHAQTDAPDAVLRLTHGDISKAITALPDASFDAVLHDPPRFGIAGELYSQGFYDHLARVLKPRGRLFHYTGTPNKLTSGRDVPREVTRRLQRAGFSVEPVGDGLLGAKR